MKRKALFSLWAIVLLLSSCGTDDKGQLLGVQDRPSWNGINPFGMVYVPSGTLTIGQSDQDIFNTHTQRPKTISISGFFMDDTEVTNNEYREYVYWVRDSLAHDIMGDYYEDDYGNERLDWEMELDYSMEELDEMYYEGDMKMFDSERKMDTRLYEYSYKWIDWQKAAHSADAIRSNLLNDETVNIYPDTLVWIRDFAYSYNEPMTRNYFWHPAFDDYPVVGVNWEQAKAFCHWRTHMWDSYRGEDEPNSEQFRLPFESEWEWAARGGRAIAPYPWGGYYIRNAKGCLLANFKPGRGNYPEDGGYYTVKADAYFPNDYGLYNMAGNVAEWTETAYHPAAYQHVHDQNPDIKYDAKDDDPEAYKRKVVRGGSWKDISYYCQTGTRNFEYQDTTKSYLGFRCALTFLGRSLGDFQ